MQFFFRSEHCPVQDLCTAGFCTRLSVAFTSDHRLMCVRPFLQVIASAPAVSISKTCS